MRRIIWITTFLLLTAASCQSRPEAIPTGTWNYKLIINGAQIGSATFTNSILGKNYISTAEMKINAGYVQNKTHQIVTETLDFEPVKLEIYNKTIDKNNISEMNTIAQFSGKKINLEIGDKKATVIIKKPFILEGNYFMHELIKRGFKKGTIIEANIFEPTVDIEEPVRMIVKVIGRENIEINGKMKNLIHLGYSIENLKNIDSYIDNKGITQKTIITMLNNRLELILIEKN